ncbi:hypothetical protein BGZ95_007685 [Linnemannia exigua]|uniref:Uncharacterized protein n=1 Tax=Linnemannia exigua TaxID=604196 RepID=A0AAD4DEU6_9FUNG|nr:hypothetical protein BGZ95_007685 [Linnemannia exigua]
MRHGQSSAHIDGRGHSQERGHGYLYDELEHLDDPPPHVHSQACFDSCPVQDIYTETSFSRFSKGARTNLYGLVVVKELGQVTTTTTTPPTSTYSGLGPHDLPLQDPQSKPMELPLPPPATRAVTSGVMSRTTSTVRNKTSIFTETGDLAYRHLPARYVLVAAGGSIKFFLGLQDTFDFTLGPSELNPPQGAGTEGSGGGGGGGVATAPPPNLEIVSMDAFERKDERGCQLVLVVSIAKAEDPAQFELRFYGVNTFAPSIRELLLQFPSTTDIQTVPLTWAPTKIIHAPLEDDPFEMVVLVGGSDSRVHIFVQDAPTTILTSMSAVPEIMPSDNLFKEQPIDTLFSVLASFPYCEYCVLSLVIKDYLTCRVIAAGTQNGTLNVGIIPRDPVTFQLDRDNAKSHTVVLFSPITTLTVYTSRVPTERRRRQKHGQAKQEGQDIQDATVDDADQEIEIEEENGIHLLVTCAIEQAWVYSDINKHGLSRRADLAECSYHDSILAAHAMDADWDGQNEVLIGTYGRQLMVFKQLPPGQEPYPKSGSGVHQQKQPQHTQHHHQQNHPQQQQRHSSNGSSSSTQQLQRQLRNSFQIQQQLHLQQLQQLQQQQQHQQLQQIHPSGLTVSSPSAIGDGVGSGGGGNGVSPVSLPQWGMTWNRRFASPVYGISSADLNDDGLEELVITTINGVSFFLPDPRTAKRRLAQAVERMRQIKEMREILEQLRRDNRKLVEDQRVKEEREKKEEEEEERLRKEKEAEEEAERKEKERRELEMEEIKKKEMEMKELEEQRLLDQQQQQFQQEQDEIKEREPFNESKHEQADTDEKRYGKEAEVDVVEGGEGPVPVKTEREDQKVDISTNADIESEPKKSVAKVEKEEGTSESVVVVAPQIETKKESGDNEANEVSVLKEEAKSEHESPEHDPDVGSQEAVNDENGAVVGKPEEPYLQERVHSTRSDYDDEKPEGD